jgi:hypothetical protein
MELSRRAIFSATKIGKKMLLLEWAIVGIVSGIAFTLCIGWLAEIGQNNSAGTPLELQCIEAATCALLVSGIGIRHGKSIFAWWCFPVHEYQLNLYKAERIKDAQLSMKQNEEKIQSLKRVNIAYQKLIKDLS